MTYEFNRVFWMETKRPIFTDDEQNFIYGSMDKIPETKWLMSEKAGYDIGTPKVVREAIAPNQSKEVQDYLIMTYLYRIDYDNIINAENELKRYWAQKKQIPLDEVKLTLEVIENYTGENDISDYVEDISFKNIWKNL